MTGERLELTVYFGERARANGGFLADAIAAIFARHELHLSVVLRGMAGFGAAQRLRTDRLLSLSEDLPVVTVAVDARERIEAALRDVEALKFHGLATTERDIAVPGEHAKLTVYARRGEQRGVVATLHRHGVAGATALLGVDGTVRGVPPSRTPRRRQPRRPGDRLRRRDRPDQRRAGGAAAGSSPRSNASASAAATARPSTRCPSAAADGRRSASTRRRPRASTRT